MIWELQQPVAELPDPWPQLPALASRLPHGTWTLIGGLMVQAHLLHAGLAIARPTDDIDLLLHIETGAINWSEVRARLRSLGYELREPAGRHDPPHRFVRIDPSGTGEQVVDVLIADHAAPRVVRHQAGGSELVRAPGGTSALRKTVDLHLDGGSAELVISLPTALGALTLKGGAYQTSSADRDRHLLDAALLAATIDDADALVDTPHLWTGSDARRLRVLARALPDAHPAWAYVPSRLRRRAQVTLRVLADGPVHRT